MTGWRGCTSELLRDLTGDERAGARFDSSELSESFLQSGEEAGS
jgi:hypothetical protein